MKNFPVKPILTLEAAQKMAVAARAEATSHGWAMVIAIVDDGANLLYLERMDNALIGSIGVAQEKAQTAVRFKRPTKAFEEAIAGGRTVLLKLGGALPIEGGLPVVVDGHVIGGIGASGATSAEDGRVAAAGLAAL
jgi:uncharacterized protein GlcG (DUF336 family)